MKLNNGGETCIHVVLFKGVPDVAFCCDKDLTAFLREYGTTWEKFLADMKDNPTPEWEVHTIQVR